MPFVSALRLAPRLSTAVHRLQKNVGKSATHHPFAKKITTGSSERGLSGKLAQRFGHLCAAHDGAQNSSLRTKCRHLRPLHTIAIQRTKETRWVTILCHLRGPSSHGCLLHNDAISSCLAKLNKERHLKRAPDTIRRLPTALTAPPPRPRAMPTQEILLWTPRRALEALMRPLLETPAREARISRRS